MAKIEVKDLEKQKKLLKASYDMWEKTISDTAQKMKEAINKDKTPKYTQDQINDRLEVLKNGESDIIEKWLFLGGTLDELKGGQEQHKPVVKKKGADNQSVFDKIAKIGKSKDSESDTDKEIGKKEEKTEELAVENEPVRVESKKRQAASVTNVIPDREEGNPMASYDIIPLPSKGECYANKQGRIAVSYLTAIDENIIISPNLYRDNMVLDIILKQKIRNQDIDPDELLDGDRDAIILFLRSAAYGNNYLVSATDPETKKTFETSIDLSKLKYKDFNLIGDENGHFDFEMPTTKDKIKFKFLNHKDYKDLDMLDEIEIAQMRKEEINKYSQKMSVYLDRDGSLTRAEKADITNAIETLSKWAEKCEEEPMAYSHRASNELEMEIVSVNGNTDRGFIHEYVTSLQIKDATELRKYIIRNTPGVDYNFEIEKPESLGGGSMKVFLQFDQFIFLTDTE